MTEEILNMSENVSFSSSFFADRMIPMHLIEQGLYLGNLQAAQDLALLQRHNITCVLSIIDSCWELEAYGPDILHRRIDLPDSSSAQIIDYVPDGLRFIHEALKAGRNVLVHCAAGISRSASMVIAYVMVKYSIDFSAAKNIVRAKRACVWPNQGFAEQLKRIDVEAYKEILF